jgi:hypothetical protein
MSIAEFVQQDSWGFPKNVEGQFLQMLLRFRLVFFGMREISWRLT